MANDDLDNEKVELSAQLAKLGAQRAQSAKEEAEAAGEFITAKKEEAMKLQEIVDLSNKLLSLQEKRLEAEALEGDAKEKRLEQIGKLEQSIKDELAEQTGSRKEAQEILDITKRLTEGQLEDLRLINEEQKKYVKALEDSSRYQESVRESTKGAVAYAAALGGYFQDYGVKLGDVVGKMKEFVSDPAGGIAGAVQGFTDVVNLENLALNVLVGMGEQMLNLVNLQTEFTKQTGMGAGMAYQGFDDAREAANDLGGALIFTREEASAAFGVLTSELPVFTRLSTEARGEIASITMALGAVGVNAGDTAVILNQMMSVMGYGSRRPPPVGYGGRHAATWCYACRVLTKLGNDASQVCRVWKTGRKNLHKPSEKSQANERRNVRYHWHDGGL